MEKHKHNWELVSIETLPVEYTQMKTLTYPSKFGTFGYFYCKRCKKFKKEKIEESTVSTGGKND